MTDVKNSGYKAAAQTALSTELNSLANDTWSALSSEFDNSTNGYMFMDIEVDLASITPTGADAAIEIYVVPSVDDTQFPSTTNTGTADEQENQQYFVGSVTLSLDAEVQIHMIRGVEVPVGKWKMFCRNRSNVGLAASGSTIKWRPWQYSSA
jgi:hypothetical protein